MGIPEDTPEELLTVAQRLTQEQMLTFLDELTQLTRKYSIIVSSEGNIDVASLRKTDRVGVSRGKYIPFWRGHFSYPLDFLWSAESEAECVHLIDMDGVNND